MLVHYLLTLVSIASFAMAGGAADFIINAGGSGSTGGSSVKITNQEATNTEKRIPIIIDMDADNDDIIAVIQALNTPSLDVRGLSVSGIAWGHGSQGQTLADLADTFRPNDKIPVAVGPCQSLTDLKYGNGSLYQNSVPAGAGGILDADLMFGLVQRLDRTKRQWRNAANPGLVENHLKNWIDKTIDETGLKPTILITGTATDVTLLFRAYPEYAKKVERIVWMAGALDVPGNLYTVPTNTKAEFNAYLDCVAGQELLANPDVSLTLVPLDFTNQVVLDSTIFSSLAASQSFASTFVHDLLELQVSPYGGADAFYASYSLWDPQALAVVMNIGVIDYETNVRLSQQCGGDSTTDGAFTRLPAGSKGANVMIAKKAAITPTAASNPILQALVHVLK
ncbi:Inosine/uridine-preferring nucleoside hydrolase domain-containing protein [Obelidium mucronatum]|nr:Inosine/uridine-preferring nucleoside hydrolase domain-containing protein [Obelidium mucronatum]